MLTRSGESTADDAWFTEWRQRELSRVVRSGVAYLDYTGAALYPESLVRADTARLMEEVLGNPHSEHGPSLQHQMESRRRVRRCSNSCTPILQNTPSS